MMDTVRFACKLTYYVSKEKCVFKNLLREENKTITMTLKLIQNKKKLKKTFCELLLFWLDFIYRENMIDRPKNCHHI